jgi:hypothetical protein
MYCIGQGNGCLTTAASCHTDEVAVAGYVAADSSGTGATVDYSLVGYHDRCWLGLHVSLLKTCQH